VAALAAANRRKLILPGQLLDLQQAIFKASLVARTSPPTTTAAGCILSPKARPIR